MAIITKVKRLSNPRRVVVRRRKLSAKQIKFFGTKAQKAALKRKRTASRSAAPIHRSRTAPVAKRRTTNPAWVVTLGPAVNPHKRSNTMPAKRKTKNRRKTVKVVAKRRRRVVATNPKRRTHRTANPKVVVRYRTRKANRRRAGVKRNPNIFGSRLGSKESMKMIGGGLAGVVATKFLPTMIPANIAPQLVTTNLGRVAVSAAAALVAGWAASKVDARFGEGVYFGGFMQVASVGLNTFLPAVYKSLGVGLGDFAPGQFAVPQNPLRIAAPGSHSMAPSGALTRTSNLGRAYAPAY